MNFVFIHYFKHSKITLVIVKLIFVIHINHRYSPVVQALPVNQRSAPPPQHQKFDLRRQRHWSNVVSQRSSPAPQNNNMPHHITTFKS